MKELNPELITDNTFKLIDKDWMLVTAKKDDKINTMTASWGGLGIMWDQQVAFVVIRSERYTKKFIDASETFSLTFLDESYRKTLGYLGSVSGRDENKIEKSNLTVEYSEDTPYFGEGRMIAICKKLYAQPISPEFFTVTGFDEKFYPEKDYHTMYIAKIEKVLIKD